MRRATGLSLTIFVFFFPWLGFLAALVSIPLGLVEPLHLGLFALGFLLTGLGITVGYHRLATHRSFETYPIVRAILLVLGSMAVEGPVISWVANHLKHHTYSDGPNDPHSPKGGFVHSHWGWLFEFFDVEAQKYAAHLLRDPLARFVSRTFILWVTLGYVIPFLIAGWEGLIWGGLVRQLAVQNVTFAVNSFCHRHGKHPFDTADQSTNNLIVGVLGLGEGWHNNHHAFPNSAFHGLRRSEFDLSAHVIRLLEATRLAWNVKRPEMHQIERKLVDPGQLPAYASVLS